MARTAFGYSANDAVDPRPQARAMPPAYSPPPQAPAVSPPPYHPQRPAPIAPPMAPPPVALRPPPTPPPGAFVPASPASAPTMFVPGGPQPAMPQGLTGPGFPRPNPPGPMLPPTLVAPPQQPPTQLQQPSGPPIMRIPAPQPPPYLASQTATRVGRPIEPWKDSLRAMMFLWGIALLIAFATPLSTAPALVFNWKLVIDGVGTARLPPLMLAAVGLLSVIVAGIPMQPAARGLIATLLGLAGILVPIVLVGMPPWQLLIAMIGMLVLVPSLLIRSEYRDAALPRILVTLGALGILLPFLLPQGGAIPLVNIFKGLIDLPGASKVPTVLALGLIVVVVMALLAWLPAPATGGAKLWGWLLILWGLIAHVTNLLVSGNLGHAVTSAPNTALVSWIAGGASSGVALGSAYLVLVGYGLASVVGKQLE